MAGPERRERRRLADVRWWRGRVGPSAPLPSPEEEAQALYAMLGRNGDTVETLRELIGFPPAVENALRAYTERYPEDARAVQEIIRFRRQVGEEFEKLLAQAPKLGLDAAGSGARVGEPVTESADSRAVEEAVSLPLFDTDTLNLVSGLTTVVRLE